MKLNSLAFYRRHNLLRRIHIRQCSNCKTYTLDDIETSFRMLRMVRNFRVSGHFAASLDPLSQHPESGIVRKPTWLDEDESLHPDVVRMLRTETPDLKVFGLEGVPLDKEFYLGPEVKYKGKLRWTIRELLEMMRKTYSGNVGIEIYHIENLQMRSWIQQQVEGIYGPSNWNVLECHERKRALLKLMESDHTSQFLGSRFSSAKIFEIEGCEALLPALWSVTTKTSELGIENIEMGMSHRGRMNVLRNFFQKSFGSICNKFNESETYSGDIKFHLGAHSTLHIPHSNGVTKDVHVSLCANPSHLEAVYPVVIGKTRAKQFYVNDRTMSRVMPLILHGDAGFCGQGIVPETMALSNLPGYRVGGAVHIIINNQIGFTTEPRQARTSYHCTDAAKMIEAPVFHVNGDDVDAVVSVCKLAVDFRQKFHRDVVVDIVCYRRHGHTNKEDPKITQPLTYKLIDLHPHTIDIYSKKLIADEVVTAEEIKIMSDTIIKEYTEEYERSREYVADPIEWLASNWQGLAISSLDERPFNHTGARLPSLQAVAESLCYVPDHIEVHPDVKHILDMRRKMWETGKGINLAFAELLAFGTLITRFSPDHHPGLRGVPDIERSPHDMIDLTMAAKGMIEHPTVHVRLSGQDCIRGTFNQRHSAIWCQKTEEMYSQLNNLKVPGDQATFTVCNSSLSEAAVLAFEYGYSLENELALTIWEAQFGDFANVAQAIIDNFIVSGEYKWNVHSALVMLLPHGFDGQGPEHSSARMERFLQLVDDSEEAIPGNESFSTEEIERGFDSIISSDPSSVLDQDGEVAVSRRKLIDVLQNLNGLEASTRRLELSIDELLDEYGKEDADLITKDLWVKMMRAWLQQNSERKHNFSVIVPSTPAQYFHGLRRQIHRPYAKPLVVMTSKWLLHHRPCESNMSEFASDTFFRRVILEGHAGDNMRERTAKTNPLVEPLKMRKIIFTCGKMFYHLYHARSTAGINDTTIVRLEQIAPFPYDVIARTLQRYPNAELVWVQEEPRNMGAWTYVKPRFDTTLREKKLAHQPIRYVGRAPSAAPATGQYRQHVAEQHQLIANALDWFN